MQRRSFLSSVLGALGISQLTASPVTQAAEIAEEMEFVITPSFLSRFFKSEQGEDYTEESGELLKSFKKLFPKGCAASEENIKKLMEMGLNLDSIKDSNIPITGSFGNSDGTKEWYLNGELHRVDGPAIEYANGNKEWYLNGEKHRVSGPAVEYANGNKEWCLNGKFHRENGPAIEYADGYKCWYLNGERHRTDGPAVEYPDGTKHWWLNGERHRVDGPAVEYTNGDKFWYLNGDRHRTDGPAVEYANGNKEWWLNGERHRTFSVK